MSFRNAFCRKAPPFELLFMFVLFFSFLIERQPVAFGARRLVQQKLVVRVMDENGVPVSSARVTLEPVEKKEAVKGETDYAGRVEFPNLIRGRYNVRVEKEAFYVSTLNDLRVGETEILEITLNHQQEFAEVMDVVYSPPAIDPAKTVASEEMGSKEIINLPYPTTRDIRNALALLPGVLQDATGQIHVNGSASNQVLDRLDGFNVTNPVTGILDLRIGVDALRSVEVQGSRYSAESGKASGGVLNLVTGMGDDRYRFSATNFIPSLQTRRGVTINDWTPRGTFSGPLRKKTAWFFEAIDAEYNLGIVKELPSGADRSTTWRLGSLMRSQVNLNQANTLTLSFLLNQLRSDHSGLSRFSPLETTLDTRNAAYLVTIKEQSYLSNGVLLDVGFGFNRSRDRERPLGRLPYVIFPEGTSGNFFRESDSVARRYQGIANLFLPPFHWRGRHQLTAGADIDRITYDQFFDRTSISILREDRTLSRLTTFAGSRQFEKNNFEISGYAQDRWSVSDRLLLELGVRVDWDQIIRSALVAPRFASSYLLTRGGDAKLTAGIGLYYDATNLELLSRPLAGPRFDRFFSTDGQTVIGSPVETRFQLGDRELKAPRFLNWSIGVERKLPGSILARVEYVRKRGSNGLAFVDRSVGGGGLGGLFELGNNRRDRYDGMELTFRRAFKGEHGVLASYTRSSARSSSVIDFSIDDPIFGRQAGGPQAWDAPNRLISWGWLPLVRRFDLAYSVEWRDGFPFSVVNQNQQLVEAPNSRRLPDYFSLSIHAERRFRLLGWQWALRAGFNNVTDRANPTGINNNVDSPQFLARGGVQHRTFVGRIRFLGRK